MTLRRATISLTAVLAAASLALSACGGGTYTDTGSNGEGPAEGATLVVDNSFDLKTADPGRQYEPTGGIVCKALYQTLITLKDSDLKTPVPELADFEFSDDDKVITLTMKDGFKFSDGNPVTVDDAYFSLKRVQGMKGNPSFLLDGIKIEKKDEKTLTLTADKPMPEIAFKLANPSLSVLNSKVVKENGGTTGEDDKAEEFLNKTAAGSGPYLIEKLDVASEVVFKENPEYTGPTKPNYKRVVLRNVQGATQLLNLQGGQSQVALDLSPQQAAQLDKNNVKLATEPSETVVFIFLNQNPAVSKVTSNKDFVQAVRKGIDYSKIVSLAGDGAVQAAGFVPSIIVGGLAEDPTNTYDAAAAKAALAKSGYSGEEVKLAYANDLTVKGIELQTFAAAIQEQLKGIGINVKLAPAPVATELDAYRGGKEEIGLWYWNPDYMHPASYLVFGPGQMVGLRAGWKTDAAVKAAHDKAAAATGDGLAAAYEDFQKAQNLTGPFVPLVQPPRSVGYAKDLTNLGLNATWTINLAAVK